jgi:nucleoside-diphosphate-sugar epimerase
VFEKQISFETPFDSVTTTPLVRPVVIGAGPVGRAIAEVLEAAGSTATVLTRHPTPIAGASTQAVDATSTDELVDAIAGADVVFQCAQPAYHRWVEEFPALQRAVVGACERVGASLVVVENLYGYGPVDGPMTETTPMRPTTRKGAVRAQMWQELETAHAGARVRVAAVRASDFIGPGVVGSAFGERFVVPLVAGRRADVLGDPDALHSVTYVPDLAAAMVHVARQPNAFGRAWHAPTAPAVTQRELVGLVAAAAGTAPSLRVVRPWMLRLVGLWDRGARETIEMRDEFEHDFVVDSSAFERAFGVGPTPLADSVAATVASFAQPADPR